ncbi:hypothetical protein [Streptomyces sp. B6B3]|uniref:glycine-rich domain-containing protein n=1 Tax=Streptomyces sp. B6B3 TaxID=3153570 RepID=UPI00325D77D3
MSGTTVAPMAQRQCGREMISESVFAKLVNRITKDHPTFSHVLAERITDQAIAFLAASARTQQPISPSGIVDIGWHTFLLHTRDYSDFCYRVAGRFIHHEPTTPADRTAMSRADVAAARERTLGAIERSGFVADEELWPVAGEQYRVPEVTPDSYVSPGALGADLADCTQCYAGCTDSPSEPGK